MPDFKKIARGLAAAGQTFAKEEKERKARETAEELARKELAMKERQIEIQEQDAKRRDEMHKLEMAQKKVLQNNQMLMQAFTESKGDPALMETAMNAYTNTGFKYKLNEAESDMEKGKFVYDIGVYEKTPEGGLQAGLDGKAKFTPLPLGAGKKVFNTPQEFHQHIIQVANPDFALAMELDKEKSKNRLQEATDLYINKLAQDKKFKAEMEETPEGKRFIEMHEAKIKALEAETAKTTKETELLGTDKGTKVVAAQAPVATVMDAYKNKVELTGAEKEMAVSNQKALKDAGYQGISVQEAYRVAQLKDDPDAQQAIAEDLQKVMLGEKTPDEFRKNAKEFRIPTKFFDDMLMQAEQEGEMAKEEAKSKKPGFFMTIIKSIFNPMKAAEEYTGKTFNKSAGLE